MEASHPLDYSTSFSRMSGAVYLKLENAENRPFKIRGL